MLEVRELDARTVPAVLQGVAYVDTDGSHSLTPSDQVMQDGTVRLYDTQGVLLGATSISGDGRYQFADAGTGVVIATVEDPAGSEVVPRSAIDLGHNPLATVTSNVAFFTAFGPTDPTQKYLEFDVKQLDANNDGKIDANTVVTFRFVYDTERVELINVTFTQGDTLEEAVKSADAQLTQSRLYIRRSGTTLQIAGKLAASGGLADFESVETGGASAGGVKLATTIGESALWWATDNVIAIPAPLPD